MHFIYSKLTAIGWSHSLIIKCNEITANEKQRACLQLGSRTNTSPRRPVLFCMCRSSSAIKWRKNDFVIKSITRSWLKRCSFHCLPCEGGKPLVPEWYFGQASSISKSPVGVIIAAWNCRCWKVIRSHMVSLSPMTLMSRISHLTTRKIKQHEYNRSRLLVLLWIMTFLYIYILMMLIWMSKSSHRVKQDHDRSSYTMMFVQFVFLWKDAPAKSSRVHFYLQHCSITQCDHNGGWCGCKSNPVTGFLVF